MPDTPVIYVDEIRDYGAKGEWCHMWSEDESALDRFAAGLGLLKQWSHLSHGSWGRFYHYDLRPSKRYLALKRGAVFMPLIDWIKQKREGTP